MSSTLITIKVVGLGHALVKPFHPDDTLAVLQEWIADNTGLPIAYQRLVSRNLNFEAALSQRTLIEIGIKDRTKIMLLHTAQYEREKESYETLMAVRAQLDELEKKTKKIIHPNVIVNCMVTEYITRICRRLDAIEMTDDSITLRQLRRTLLERALAIENNNNAGKNDNSITLRQLRRTLLERAQAIENNNNAGKNDNDHFSSSSPSLS
jgi:hypothetical protein